ncbi:UvrD-helicase domain-containing protein [Pseudomonas chlororaphis]|uniref:UvrD-helicase domain-containing protein n=1 Tax=Pseudomonas chlororaphis TaxID=587753 RepID=UPI002368343A|nr:UvrD-helicase domain-containing protein [Pseudomonas chlororaphis]WDH32426.1 UvrD-helicase domain-containing protein [Pseudomonas chlororaphis]WDH38510.1 UvrD-helicase domain-containing protein [Pseudomonas chlororaphis]
MNFTQEQLDYLAAPLDRHVYLKACPGSGKTEVVAAMVARIVQEWSRSPSGIAVLTFSNSATDELRNRVHKYLGEPIGMPHMIATFDSFVLNRLVASIASEITGYAGREGDFRIRILDKTANIYRARNSICDRWISACKYDYDLGTTRFVFSTGELGLDKQLNATAIDQDTFKDLIATKRRLWRGGFATFGDIDMLALKAFKDKKFDPYFSRIARRFPLVIVDECQDLSAEQLRIVEHLTRFGMAFHFVGDLNQSIYGFRKSNPENVTGLMGKLKFEPYELKANWRSGQAIVDLCTNILGGERIKGNPNIASGQPQILEYEACPSELLPTIRAMTQGYTKVVLVARGHTTLQRLRNGETFEGIELLAVACISASTGNLKDIRESLRTFAKWLANKLQLQVTKAGPYCPIVMESRLAWRKFLHESLKFMVANGAGNSDQTWSAWVRTAKLAIRQLPVQPFVPVELREELDALKDLNLVARKGKGDKPVSVRVVSQEVLEGPPDALRYETIHQVKGETHDVTVVVSSQQPGVHQSHWQDWLRDRGSEAARFAYVASSRPQHMLIWAVKKLKAEDRPVLAQLGFEVPQPPR